MLIETLIKPRRDGTVTLQTNDGAKYVFAPNKDGHLVCDVTDEQHAGWALSLGNFFPFEGDAEAKAGLEGDEDSDEDQKGEVPPAMTAANLAEMLANLDKSGLLAYAQQNGVAGVDGRMGVDKLREKITEAMNAE